MKTAVIYWSGTGNTEAMANAVAEGMKEAGAEVTMLTPDQVQAGELGGYGAIAFGCPAMGSEVLEEMDFQPMFDVELMKYNPILKKMTLHKEIK